MKLSLFLLPWVLSQSLLADEVEFQPFPVDVKNNCSSVILMGTKRFAGTAFVAPKIFLSMKKSGEKLFEIIPLSQQDEYLLRIGIYVPINPQQAIEWRNNDSELVQNSCDYNVIRTRLATVATKASGSNTTSPVLRLSPLPISRLSIAIDGLDEVYSLGQAGDIIDYFGTDQIAEFKIKGKDKLREILDRLNGQIGLAIRASLQFSARVSSDYLAVNIDTRKVSSGVDAAFKGQINVVHADLAANIATSLSSMNLDIYQEGSSDAFNQLANSLIVQFTTENPKAVTINPVQPTDKPTPKPSTPISIGTNPGTTPSTNPADSRTLPLPFIDAEPSPTVATLENTAVNNDPVATYNVKAVIKYLNEKRSLRLVYQRMGGLEQKTYHTSTVVKADFDELSSRIVRISSDRLKTALPTPMRKGESLTLSFEGVVQEPLKVLSNKRYLSVEEIDSQRELFAKDFPVINDARSSLMNLENNGLLKGVYTKYPTWWNAFMPWGSWSFYYETKQYMWGQVEREASYATTPMKVFEMTPDNICHIPFKVQFSKVGSRLFSLEDLTKSNSYFNGTFDADGGKIVISSKANLGTIKLVSIQPTSIVSFYKTMRFEEEKRAYGGVTAPKITIREDYSTLVEASPFRNLWELRLDRPDGYDMQFDVKSAHSFDRMIIIP